MIGINYTNVSKFLFEYSMYRGTLEYMHTIPHSWYVCVRMCWWYLYWMHFPQFVLRLAPFHTGGFPTTITVCGAYQCMQLLRLCLWCIWIFAHAFMKIYFWTLIPGCLRGQRHRTKMWKTPSNTLIQVVFRCVFNIFCPFPSMYKWLVVEYFS